MKQTFLIAALALNVLAIPAWAINRYVPSQYSTIQAALDACGDGDTVIVADGTYTGASIHAWDGETIPIDVTIRSENGPANCIIEGVGFSVGNWSPSQFTLIGFTIRNTYLAVGHNANLTIKNCVIRDNSLGFEFLGHTQTVTNCLITGNSVGIRNEGGDCTISNCTITDAIHTAPGGTVSTINSSLVLGPVTACCDIDPSRVIISYSNVSGGEARVLADIAGGAVLTWGEGNIDADPLFQNPAAGDYHLMAGSPCINSGDPSGNYAGQTDIDGDQRILFGRVDMGADEFSEAAAVSLNATNNWDGKTIDLSWSSGVGSVKIYRRKESGSFQYVTPVSSLSYPDIVDEPGKNYTYVLKNASDVNISNEATVKAEVVAVLVRGYSATKPKDLNYWKPDGHSELVDVQQWFEDNGVTCWVPPQGIEEGEGLSGWKTIYDNSDELETFINSRRTGVYQNARINLVGHSMGGLVARKYAKDNPGTVSNVFCIQTPHTGSTLATIIGMLPVDVPATSNLTPTYLNLYFNKEYDYLGNTELYSFWSREWWRVYHNGWLATGAAAIGVDPRYNSISGQIEFPITDSGSDGAVPAVSAQGRIYIFIPTGIPGAGEISVLREKVSIDEDKLLNSDLDHYSCHRHPCTLEDILDWLGLPHTQTCEQPMDTLLVLSEEVEPYTVPQYYVTGFTGEFNTLTDVNETASIGNSDSAYFRAITSDSNCSFILSDPCGVTYDPCYAASEPNVTYNAEDGLFMYEVNSPVTGAWTLSLSTTVTPPNSVNYGLTVFESENITLYSYSNPSWANTDANILIVAALTENDNPLTDANIVAHVVLPDVNSWSVDLYDDGLHSDANANDGFYANTFTTTSQEGTYNGQIRATGLSSLGTAFERNSSLAFSVSAPDVNFTGDINDLGVDLNANALYDILRFTIPIDVWGPNEYLLTATLSDSNDDLIRLLSTGSLSLPAGPNTLWLEVSAEDIVTHDVNGPYTLSDITIANANTGLTIAEANDYNTAAYLVSDFEQLDTDGDGLSDNFELSIGTDVNLPDSDYDGISDYNEVGYDGDANSYNVATDLDPLNVDTDGDGMSDAWEINFGYDPLVDDGAKDNDDDTDGLPNLVEFQNSTLPNNSDTDSDGIGDGNEINVYTTNPTNMDTDSDGLIDGDEVNVYGTIPTNPDTDDDTVMDGPDNCKLIPNSDQNDLDADNLGDICDNCPNHPNYDQSDMDFDGNGDECDCLADVSNNDSIGFEDFAMFALHWLDINCTTPDYCSATDFDKSGTVDFTDLAKIVSHWLEYKLDPPETCWD